MSESKQTKQTTDYNDPMDMLMQHKGHQKTKNVRAKSKYPASSRRSVKARRTPNNLYKPFCFDIPGPPVGKQRTRSGYYSTKHRTPKKTKEYERHVATMAWRASLQRGNLDDSWLSDKVYMDLKIYHRNGCKPDSDNVVKAIADGLTGVLWINDRNVLPRVQYETYPDDNPRVEVTINKIEEVYGSK